MYKFKLFTILFLFPCLVLLVFGETKVGNIKAQDRKLELFKYNGNTLVLSSINHLIEKKYPKVSAQTNSFQVTGSCVGIKELIDNKCSLVFSTRLMTKDELKKALGREINPVCIPICYLPLFVLVNKNNPVKNIELTMLRDISLGKVNNWEGSNENDKKIMFITHGTSTTHMFQKKILNGKKIPDLINRVSVAKWTDLILKINNNKNALGYSIGGPQIKDFPVKPLNVNGHSPTAVNIRAGKYPLVQIVYAILDAKKLQNSQEFDFIKYLLSTEGASFMQRETSLIPLVKKSAR